MIDNDSSYSIISKMFNKMNQSEEKKVFEELIANHISCVNAKYLKNKYLIVIGRESETS